MNFSLDDEFNSHLYKKHIGRFFNLWSFSNKSIENKTFLVCVHGCWVCGDELPIIKILSQAPQTLGYCVSTWRLMQYLTRSHQKHRQRDQSCWHIWPEVTRSTDTCGHLTHPDNWDSQQDDYGGEGQLLYVCRHLQLFW